MPKVVLKDETDFRPSDEPMAAVVSLNPFVEPVHLLGPAGFLGTRDEIEKELDLIAGAIRGFHTKQPDQVMRECSAYSARLTEMAVLLHRVEASNRRYTQIRTQQVQRYLDELDRQFKVSSRLIEVMRQDLVMIGAQP